MALTWDSTYDWSSADGMMGNPPFGPIYNIIVNMNLQLDRISQDNLDEPLIGDTNYHYYLMDQAFNDDFIGKFKDATTEEVFDLEYLETEIGASRPPLEINYPPSAKWIWWMKEALDLIDAAEPSILLFGVYPQANVQRGTAFDLIVQAFDANGDPDLTYVPSETLTVALASSDASDTYTVTTIDATGWVNGSKTVSGTISGGTGNDDTGTITVSGDGHEGTSDTFNIKDTVAGTPAQWKVTFLDIASMSLPVAPGVGTCITVNCAQIDHVFSGIYSSLASGQNTIATYNNTSEPVGGGSCTDPSYAVIRIEPSDLDVVVLAWAVGEGAYFNVGWDASSLFDSTSWQTQRLILVPRLSRDADCISPDNVIVIVEAVA